MSDSPTLHVAPGPHLFEASRTSQRMMIDVLVALVPIVIVAISIFRWHAVFQIAVCVASSLAAEALFSSWRGRRAPLGDGSAAVTGLILGLSLPWSAPWYVGLIASFVAIGLGKAAFGGLGYNLFNPAMVGRAFVMVSFASALGGAAYVKAGSKLEILTQATPLSAAKEAAETVAPELWPLFIGSVNGSLGETSALAAIVGGIYLCWRHTVAWEIPAGVILATAVMAGIAQLTNPDAPLTVLHHLTSGALLFAAFFIAPDPVTSPISPKGRWVFGAGIGVLIVLIRLWSNYPEGVVFAVLFMNAWVPLINRWTIPTPFGGAVPQPSAGGAS